MIGEDGRPKEDKPKRVKEKEREWDIGRLNELYKESETCDSDVFAEMKTNILLVSGQHYKRVQKGLYRNMQMLGVEKGKRLRLVKNHIAKAISDIKDVHAQLTPGVLPYPKLEHERDCQKAAELAKSVAAHIEKQNDFPSQKEQYLNCFVTTGEVCAKVFFNPVAGGLKAYKQKVSEDGRPVFLHPEGHEVVMPPELMAQGIDPKQMGLSEAPDKDQPVFKGQIMIEKFEPYNLLRAKNSRSIRTSRYLIYRKMVELCEAKALIENSNLSDDEKEERLSWITDSGETTYKIFDGTTGSFQDSKGQILWREFYFRQSPEFPRGRYFITCENGILFEGEIPFGEVGELAFPIKHASHEIIEGSARGFSVIKRLKPSQLEINRCASSVAEVQQVMGWDKMVTSKNAKVSRGIDIPGMRVIHTTDGAPVIIPGRAGEQFIGWLEHNIKELYDLAKLPENNNPISQATDPKVELFKRQSQRARFTEPAGRLARFYCEILETSLYLATKYLSDDDVIEAVGKTKAVDIPEFKAISRLDYRVKLMEVTDDLDSMVGRAQELETIVQYLGKDLPDDAKTAILNQFPALNKALAFKDLTIDRENVDSDLLALDRGQYRAADRDDKHELYVKHLTNRIKSRDFEMLPEEIQQMFYKKRKEHQDFLAQLLKEEQEAEQGFIPSGGALAKADLYVNPDPNNPYKTQRAVFPTEALQWLKEKLEKQGSSQNLLGTINNQGAEDDIAKAVAPMNQPQAAPGAGPSPLAQIQSSMAQPFSGNQDSGPAMTPPPSTQGHM